MIIAAAQTIARDGNVAGNLDDHYRLTEQAADYGAQLVVFPELSITGYLVDGAAELSFVPDDVRLGRLQALSAEKNIVIVAGAPLSLPSGLYISSFIIQPDNSTSIYTKQFLHTGEEKAYVPGFDFDPQIEIGGETVSFAICADITNPLHPENASKRNATLYIASIFYTPKSIGRAHSTLSDYARKYSMSVLMSNYGPSHQAVQSGGRSSFWNSMGEHIAGIESTDEGLLILTREHGMWTGRAVQS